jgi:hypothetical protein
MNNRFETQQSFDNELTISIDQAFNDIRAKNQRLIEINKELVKALESIEDMYSSDQTVGDACLALYEARNTSQAALAKARGTE